MQAGSKGRVCRFINPYDTIFAKSEKSTITTSTVNVVTAFPPDIERIPTLDIAVLPRVT